MFSWTSSLSTRFDVHVDSDDDRQAWERSEGAATRPLPPGYRPRQPEGTILHRVVRENLPTFLEAAREHGPGLPLYVADELKDFLTCGVLAHGFARVRCTACGDEILVGFSCKSRGICPSCTARRATDCAAHLVDAVLPAVPLRQWVLTFPKRVRWILVKKPKLIGPVLAIFLRALTTFQRARAHALGIDDGGQSGAITFVQRFGSALQLNVHLHIAVPDGLFVEGTFHRLPPPRDEDVDVLLRKTAKRVVRLLKANVDDNDEFANNALEALDAASLASNKPAGDGESRPKRLTTFLEGFSLNASVKIHENDRQGRERLCLYGARGAITLSRLTGLPDGRVSYHMKRPLPDGRTHLVMTGVELLKKLAPLIPPPKLHILRFHGVFAPNAKQRSAVVPKQAQPQPACVDEAPPKAREQPPASPYRLDWAAALKRVFGTEILLCLCGGRRKMIAFIEKASAVKAILEHLGLPSVPLPIGKPRGPPELFLDN